MNKLAQATQPVREEEPGRKQGRLVALWGVSLILFQAQRDRMTTAQKSGDAKGVGGTTRDLGREDS